MRERKQRSSSDQQRKREPVRTGQGADSAFGKMLQDRPLVHRPHPKDEESELQHQADPQKQ